LDSTALLLAENPQHPFPDGNGHNSPSLLQPVARNPYSGGNIGIRPYRCPCCSSCGTPAARRALHQTSPPNTPPSTTPARPPKKIPERASNSQRFL
jgi:hypothetical protein